MSGVLAKLGWPEPIQRVQTLAEVGIKRLPSQYVRPQNERPQGPNQISLGVQIPVIDLSGLQHVDRRHNTIQQISNACKHWGFCQIINHGVSAELMKSALETSKQFFKLPVDEKEKHANDPLTYEGYGSRLGVQKDAILDWGDYYFHYFLPLSIRNESKWPSNPPEYRRVMHHYCKSISEAFTNLLSVLSEGLGLRPNRLMEAFGGEEESEVCVRLNYYPPCPQPDLTFGVSAHSDPGGITFLLQDDIGGLEVRKGESWVPVDPIPNALVVNVGDQMEILTNGMYKSIEHRGLVNQTKERMSLAVFCNPNGQNKIGPLKELVNDSEPPSYREMTFSQYRKFIRTTGNKGKDYVNSISSGR